MTHQPKSFRYIYREMEKHIIPAPYMFARLRYGAQSEPMAAHIKFLLTRQLLTKHDFLRKYFFLTCLLEASRRRTKNSCSCLMPEIIRKNTFIYNQNRSNIFPQNHISKECETYRFDTKAAACNECHC